MIKAEFRQKVCSRIKIKKRFVYIEWSERRCIVMKIGIITFHFVSNHGGVLQAFALQRYLEKSGHDVSIIDYRPAYHTVRYTAWKNPFIYAAGYWGKFKKNSMFRRMVLTLRSFVRCIYLNVRQTDRETAKYFNAFITAHLHLTKRYRTLEQIRKEPPQMEAYITGSDQLWNPDLFNGRFDEAYFLKFGSPSVLHISYAVSIGGEPDDRSYAQLKDLCSELSAVSLRETSTKAIEAIGKVVHICIDPTLLNNAEDYLNAEGKNGEEEPYIFVYGLETNDAITKAVALAERKYGCRVINGSPNRVRLSGCVKNIKSFGPDQFLSYVKNAVCVVTNSFHGTAFSVIYKKDFITVPHSARGRRMTELLTKTGLQERLWGDVSFDFERQINWNAVYQKLNELRYDSGDYLDSALHNPAAG